MLAIILYIDGTWLSKGGGHKCTPISVTLGNFTLENMNKSIAKEASASCFHEKIILKNNFIVTVAGLSAVSAGNKETKEHRGLQTSSANHLQRGVE